MTLDASAVADRLDTLATDERYERHEGSLTALASDLRAGDGGLWAPVDLFALCQDESEPRPDERQRVAAWLENVRNVLVLVPLVITWFGVSRAIAAYDELMALPPEEQGPLAGASFVQLWTSGFDGRTWWSFDRVAVLDAAVILVVILLSAAAGVLRAHADDRAADRRRRDTDDLRHALRDAGRVVGLQSGRAPQNLPEEVGKVIPVLQGLLQDLRDAQRDLAASYAEGKAYTADLADTSRELASATRAIGAHTQAFEVTVRELGAEATCLAAGTADIGKKVGALLATQQTMATANTALADAQTRTAERLSEVADNRHRAAQAAIEAAEALSKAITAFPGEVTHMRDAFVGAVREELAERRRASDQIEAAGRDATSVASTAQAAIGELTGAVDSLVDAVRGAGTGAGHRGRRRRRRLRGGLGRRRS